MGEPPSSGAGQLTCTPAPSLSAEGTGEPGSVAAGGSKATSRRLPPDWRTMLAFLARESPEAEAAVQKGATQPSAYAATTRPSRSITRSLKSSRFLSLPQSSVPLLQIEPT